MKNSNQLSDAPYFIANKAKGIYCFPWCNDQSKNKEIINFETRSKAEMEGYKPCKSCHSGLPDGSWKEDKNQIVLFTPKEFSFEENLKYLANAQNECLYKIKGKRVYKALLIENEIQIFEVSSDHENSLIISFLEDLPKLKWIRAAVARYVRDWFDLDTNLLPFYKIAKNDLLLRKAVDKFYGLRNMGIPDLFEAICWGIIGQQINLTYAYTLKRRLVETFGQSVEYNGEIYWIFPEPEDIASRSKEDLMKLQMTVRKCEYIIGVANLMAEGKLTKNQLLLARNGQNIEKMLVKIRGIGPWTAHYVMMRCLKVPNAFPVDDVGLQNSIKYLLESETKPLKEEILRLSEKWEGWESYATFYLWRFLY